MLLNLATGMILFCQNDKTATGVFKVFSYLAAVEKNKSN